MKRLNNWFMAGLVFVSRFGLLPPNMAPVGSLGFFNANIWLYMAVVVGFDLIYGGLYRGFLFTYLGFLGYYVLGRLAKTNRQKFLLLPLASLVFFFVSNLGVWWYWYPRTVEGMVKCYMLAVPFYRNTLLGDIVFGYGVLLWQSRVVLDFVKVKNGRVSSLISKL